MKLKGSKTEQDFREELTASHNNLFGDDGSRLLRVLRTQFNDIKTAYILEWVPDQDEEVYWVLIDDKIIMRVELQHGSLELKAKGELIPLLEYQKGLKRIRQIKLAVLDLAQNDMKAIQ